MTNKKKYYLFAGSIPFILLLVYLIAVKPTLKEYNGFKNWSEIYKNTDNYPVQLRTLTNKLLSMDRKLGINEEGEPLSNVDVLSTVISQCEANMVLLTEMPPPKQVVDDQILICTYEFELTGEFKNLLQFLFAIESKKGFAKLVSVDFYVDRKDLDEVQLFCRAYMQTYIINKDGYEL